MGGLNNMDNIKALLKRANLNFKIEIVIIFLVNCLLIGAMIATYIFTHNNLFFIPFIFIIVLANAVCFYRYLFLYNKSASNQIKEITSLFRYLYLDINNQIKVKDALKNLKERASLKTNQKLETLLEETKKDDSLVPYLHFAANFSSVLIEEVMINLYRYEQRSHKENLLHFNEAYLKLKKSVEDDIIHDSNNQYEFIKTSAIIGTALIVILVIIVTIIVVEEYIHG